MSIGISLGWNCSSAIYGVNHNIRQRKSDGYNTCVFDIMVSNYKGVVKCIEDDFKYFLDLDYITIQNIRGEPFIVNTYYNFWFNHESPGHANLYIKEKWENGINHFVKDNYSKLIERYQARITNFRNYLHSGEHIIFICDRYNTHNVRDIPELNNAIKHRYPSIHYDFIFISTKEQSFVESHLLLMGYNKDDDEIKRLYN